MWPVATVILLTTGCATSDTELAESAAADLVGMKVDALRSCAGEPTREEQGTEGTALTYVLRMRRAIDAGPPPQYGLAGPRLRVAESTLPPERGQVMACEARMLVRGGVVVAVDFDATGGPMLCQRIVRRCVTQ